MPQSPQSDGNRIAAEKPGVPGRPRHAEVRFVIDSLLEGDGFEPSVPQQIRSDLRTAGPTPSRLTASRGTGSSNPSPSGGESGANRNWPAGTFRSSAEAGPGTIPPQGDRGFES